MVGIHTQRDREVAMGWTDLENNMLNDNYWDRKPVREYEEDYYYDYGEEEEEEEWQEK